jgi:queuine tRNA-ribosyltransferase catalytic subunit
LVTIHNVHYQLNLMKRVREAILEDRYPAFVKSFFGRLYPDGAPHWAVDALQGVGVDLNKEKRDLSNTGQLDLEK